MVLKKLLPHAPEEQNGKKNLFARPFLFNMRNNTEKIISNQ